MLRQNGIPKEDWHKYDVDHRPAYDPEVEPDHNRYTLVPMLRSDHSRKTAKEDGAFGRGGGGQISGRGAVYRTGESRTQLRGIKDRG